MNERIPWFHVDRRPNCVKNICGFRLPKSHLFIFFFFMVWLKDFSYRFARNSPVENSTGDVMIDQ